jgi:hypothetical protein
MFLTNAGAIPPGTLIHSDSKARRIPMDIQSLEGIDDYSGTVSIEFPFPLEVETTVEFIQIVTK